MLTLFPCIISGEEKGADGESVPEEDSAEVKVARDELKTLEKEQELTDRLKHKLLKELDNAKHKAGKLEEVSDGQTS